MCCPDRPVVNVSAEISLLPSVDYNVMFSGVGSTLNSIDTSLGLNWNLLPANSTSQTHPLPWGSNKLLLTDGAVAYLANDTVLAPLPGVFSISAVLPDAASQAYFYRWAQFNLTGRGGFLPIPDAQVKVYYAYSTIQADNATANALNDLASSNPEIWGYVQYRDAQHGVQAYGESNVVGRAAVLLASSNLTGPTLPDVALPRRIPYRRDRSRGRRKPPLVQLVGEPVPRRRRPVAPRRRGTRLWPATTVQPVLRRGRRHLGLGPGERVREPHRLPRPDAGRAGPGHRHRHGPDRPGPRHPALQHVGRAQRAARNCTKTRPST